MNTTNQSQQTDQSTAGHTPGPWTITPCASHDGLGAHAFDIEVDGETLAHVYPSQDMEASARLIAAAPELFEALKDAEFLLRQVGNNWKEAAAMVDSFKRSAADARAILAKVNA